MTNKKHSFSKNIFPSDNGEIIDWIERSKIEFQFTAISQHVDFVNDAIKQEQEQLESMAFEFVQGLDGYDEDEKNSLYHAFINGDTSSFNYEYSAINSFSQIQWRSEFLVIYSYFEHVLNHLCYVVQKRSDFELGVKDIYGQGIERARTYLVKLAKVESPFKSGYWQRAKFLSEIRNTIAHKNSEVAYKPDDLKSLYAKLKQESYIELDSSYEKKGVVELMLTHEFLKQSVQELQSVVFDVCNFQLYGKQT